MPSNPLAALPATTALGAILLGFSGGLLAIDVAGTVMLDADRRAALESATAVTTSPSQPASPVALPHVPSAQVAAALPAPSAAAVVVVPPPVPAARPPQRRIVVALSNPPPPSAPARALRPADATPIATRFTPIVVVNRVTSPLVLAPHAPPISAPAGGGRLADLRTVRRFVMRRLAAQHRHLCVISAMTYPIADHHVVVDLVFRDDRGRWAEKAVVARRGSQVALIGTRQRPMPDRAIASTGIHEAR